MTKQYAATKDYLTFIDTNEIVNKYLSDHSGYTKASFYKDNTHPKNENYVYFINALTEAGCEIADK